MRVSPTTPEPTHHFALKDRRGTQLGLSVYMERSTEGRIFFERAPFRDERIYIKNPVETTALKQTSGSSSYADFDYPYSPIVQDDLSGGRGNMDFERDSTKYYDSFRCRSGRANKAYAGPQEQYVDGLRGQDKNVPGSVRWVKLLGTQRYIYKRFLASSGYTIGLVWLLVRRLGKPGDLTVKLYSDAIGSLDAELTSITIPYTETDDILMEWLNQTMTQALSDGVYYWLVLVGDAGDNDTNQWLVACNDSAGTTYATETLDTSPDPADFDLYFRLTDANSEKTCIPFNYKEQAYFVVSGASGAPNLYMAGDRGTADSNASALNKLKDATKTWETNEHAGYVVKIIGGTGRNEPRPWRTIVSNTSGELVVDEDWTITHDTTTEYVILGTKIQEITGHGLTAPVTSVIVSPEDIIYFCMGDSVAIRRMREITSSGVWTRQYDNEGDAKSKAVFMVYKPTAKRFVIANNNDANGDVSVNTGAAAPPAWGTNLTWGTAVPVDSKYSRITGMICHPDSAGDEAVWVFKEDMPYIYSSGTPYPVNLEEMRTVRNSVNGVNPIRHGVYLYFPMLQGLERYYGGQFDDIGPNVGEGLPENRRGSIVSMVGYPGRFFAAIDAGDTGYSSVMDSDGWHERYRAPKGQRITAMFFQVTPDGLDRLWIWQGNDLIWLPFPSESTNDLEDAQYEFVPEFAVTLARMHAGMYDVQKLVKRIKLQTENLEIDETTGEPICWFELDYRVNDETEWTTLGDVFNTSPTQEIDFTSQYGIAGKRLQVRLRGYTADASKTPIFLAIIISAVLRTDVKNMYGPFTFLLTDDERVGVRELDMPYTAAEKLKILEDWADASNDSMLSMSSVSSLCHGKMVFINIGTRRQVGFSGAENNPYKGDAYLVSLTMQEA